MLSRIKKNQKDNQKLNYFVIQGLIFGMLLFSQLCKADESAGNGISVDNSGIPAENIGGYFSVVGMADFYSPAIDSDSNSGALESSSKPGWGLGLLGEIFFAKAPVTLELGLLFAHRKNEFSSPATTNTQTADWLMMPFAAKLRFAKLFSVGVGPYLAYRLNDIANQVTTNGTTTSSDIPADDYRFDVGGFVSAGVIFPMRVGDEQSVGLMIEGRYLYGFKSISVNDVDFKSRDIQVLVGLQFIY
jgi:hypothetical protein